MDTSRSRIEEEDRTTKSSINYDLNNTIVVRDGDRSKKDLEESYYTTSIDKSTHLNVPHRVQPAAASLAQPEVISSSAMEPESK